MNRDDAWFKRYHVFSVEWTPKAYVFRVDGVQTLRLTQGVSQVPEFLILSMLSSDWELPTLDRATLPNATEIDWVRVWQQDRLRQPGDPPDPDPVDVHRRRAVGRGRGGQLPVRAEQAQDQELVGVRHPLGGPVDLATVDAEDVLLRGPLDGEDVVATPPGIPGRQLIGGAGRQAADLLVLSPG